MKVSKMGIIVGGSNIFTLDFADDQILLAEFVDYMLFMLRKLDEKYKK